MLRDIMFGDRRHFRELTAGSEEGIATNILASRLKQLVAAGLLPATTLAVASGRRTRSPRRASKCSGSWSRSATGASPAATASAAYGSAPDCFATGAPELVTAKIDELRELHLGVPRPDRDAPRASDQLGAAYEAALLDKTSNETPGR